MKRQPKNRKPPSYMTIFRHLVKKMAQKEVIHLVYKDGKFQLKWILHRAYKWLLLKRNGILLNLFS